MASITVQDTTTEAEIEISDDSLVGQSRIQKLISKAGNFINEFSAPVSKVHFNALNFSVDAPATKIPLNDLLSLRLSEKTSFELSLCGPDKKQLFGDDELTPSILIAANEYWLSVCLGTAVDVGVGASAAGFGAAISQGEAVNVQAYTRFDGTVTPFKEALRNALQNLSVSVNAQAVRKHAATDVVHSYSVAGTLRLGASYSLPISANGLSLAQAKIPVTVSLDTDLHVKLAGSVSLSGEFDVRFWKQSETLLVFAVYKKKGTTLSANFSSAAGVGAGAFNVDITSRILTALSPKVDAESLTGDPKIGALLKDSIDRSIALSLDSSLSTSATDESALVYSIDLSFNNEATDAAIDAALIGNWAKLAELSNATELKNAVRHAVEQKSKLVINLLGLYNHESVADFIQSSTVVHSPEDGSVTITDRATAKYLSADSTPYVADKNRLRRALDDATISTAAYSFAQTGNAERFDTKQTLKIYQEQMDRASLQKRLKLGIALGILSPDEISSKLNAAKEYKNVLFEAEQIIDAEAATNMFYADPASHTPRTANDLANSARQIIAEFLDPANPADALRLQGLGPNWNPEKTPDKWGYSDWVDIMWWASAIANVGKPLAAVTDAFAKLPVGADASKDADFMHKCAALTSALENAAKDTHSAFEEGWSLALTNEIARNKTRASIRVSWNGTVQLEGSRGSTATAMGSAG